MANRRDRLNPGAADWAQQLLPGFSRRRTENGFCGRAGGSPYLALFFALVVGVASGFAQTTGGSRSEAAGASLAGIVTVTDAQGQAELVPGVVVKLTSTS